MKVKYIIYCLAPFLIGFSSCKPEEDTKKKVSADQASFLNNYAYNIILPAYKTFQQDILALETELQNYNSANHDNLKPLMDSAYLHWQACAMFDFGPASTYSLESNINIFPTNEASLLTAIENEQNDISASTYASIKGLSALDYITYSKDTLTATEIAYYQLAIDDIQYRIDNTVKDWDETYGSYFISNIGYDAGSSVCFLMNGFVKYFEKPFRDGKLGYPVGMRSSGLTLPQNIESLTSNRATELLQKSAAELKAVFYGKGGLGFDYLLKSDDSTMDDSKLNAMDALWDKIESTTAGINKPLDVYVTENQADGKLLYADIQSQLENLKIDMINSLSLRIKYVDNDGD